MKKLIMNILLLTGTAFLAVSCYDDNEYDLYPFKSSACDSLNTTYSATISQIMSDHCNVCHAASIASGGIITDNYQSVHDLAAAGTLWAAVNWESGVVPMPNGGTKLSSCDLAKIKNWINSGSPNN
jgi:hypothetical protein